MNSKKISILSITILCMSVVGFSQDIFKDYGITPGIRLGSNYDAWYGISARQNFNEGSLELIVTPANERITITGLVAVQNTLDIDIDGVSYFYGIGAHAGINNNAGIILGADAIAGIEYEIPDIPILVSIDIKPALDISPDLIYHFNQGALTVRYTFGR